MLLPRVKGCCSQGVCKYLSWVTGNINNVSNVYSLHIPQVAEKQGGTQRAWEWVPNVLGTKYNIKCSDDVQDTKQGVANDTMAGVTDSTTAAAIAEDSGFAAL